MLILENQNESRFSLAWFKRNRHNTPLRIRLLNLRHLYGRDVSDQRFIISDKLFFIGFPLFV
ncbi:hypothetical protein MTE2_4888 [Klebsiella pneumoniae VA360]|nr:hypothetical protein MTE2_4888 [Klebsiella pneumoniae VA360]